MLTNYFAYGSNMDKERMTQRKVIFSRRERGILRGYRLDFNKSAQGCAGKGYANIVPDENSSIEEALYEIEATSLPNLDSPEGYPNEYLKIAVTVSLPSRRKQVCAITYVANPTKVRNGLKPDKEYIGHLLKGKDILSSSYL